MQRPLHLAVRNKKIPVLKVLIAKGADPESKYKVLEDGLYIHRSILEYQQDAKSLVILKRAIENNYIDPVNCVVFGTGLTGVQKAGTVGEFTVLARDKYKNFKRKGGDNIK